MIKSAMFRPLVFLQGKGKTMMVLAITSSLVSGMAITNGGLPC